MSELKEIPKNLELLRISTEDRFETFLTETRLIWLLLAVTAVGVMVFTAMLFTQGMS